MNHLLRLILVLTTVSQVQWVNGNLVGSWKVTLIRVIVGVVPYLLEVEAGPKTREACPLNPNAAQGRGMEVAVDNEDMIRKCMMECQQNMDIDMDVNREPGCGDDSSEEVFKGLELRPFATSSEEDLPQKARKFMNSLIKLGNYKFIDLVGSSEEDLTWSQRMDKWRKSLQNYFENNKKDECKKSKKNKKAPEESCAKPAQAQVNPNCYPCQPCQGPNINPYDVTGQQYPRPIPQGPYANAGWGQPNVKPTPPPYPGRPKMNVRVKVTRVADSSSSSNEQSSCEDGETKSKGKKKKIVIQVVAEKPEECLGTLV